MGDFMEKESKQHFLLSAKARTLSVYEIMQITHEQALVLFKESGRKEQPTCPQSDTAKIIIISYVDASNGVVSAVIIVQRNIRYDLCLS